MTTLDIIREYLTRNGFDGLCYDDCGCGLDDLAPCGDGPRRDCVAAVGDDDKYLPISVDTST